MNLLVDANLSPRLVTLLEDAGVAEEGLVGPDGTTLPRASAQRAFWFGWRAQYPETLLVQ